MAGIKFAPKLVAEVVVIRRHPVFGTQVLTQLRTVKNKDYDHLYDQTWEACGETVEDTENIRQELWESIVAAALRGLKEELGISRERRVELIGADGSAISTRPGKDKILFLQSPYCFLQQLLGPQPWVGLGFVAVVPSDTESIPDKEGEVGGHHWWKPAELLAELINNPAGFEGFDYPLFLKVCNEIIAGKLVI